MVDQIIEKFMQVLNYWINKYESEKCQIKGNHFPLVIDYSNQLILILKLLTEKFVFKWTYEIVKEVNLTWGKQDKKLGSRVGG